MRTALNLLGKTSFHNKHIQEDRDLYEEITLGIQATAGGSLFSKNWAK